MSREYVRRRAAGTTNDNLKGGRGGIWAAQVLLQAASFQCMTVEPAGCMQLWHMHVGGVFSHLHSRARCINASAFWTLQLSSCCISFLLETLHPSQRL